ncbi:MAG TPA: ABC transporter permease [Terracidiphilus sp.]
MGWFQRVFRRRGIYTDISDEVRQHLDEKARQLMRSEGLTRKDAEEAARRAFGNVTLMEERSREVWQWPTLESLWADAKYAARQLVKSPGITLVAIVTLALGIGASTAIFTLTWNIILKSLPVPHPERLVEYELRNGDTMHGLSGPLYRLMRQRQTTSTDLLAWASDEKIPVRHGDQVSLETIQLLTGNSFRILEMQPYLGRLFSEQDEQSLPAVLSYDFWQSRFAGNRDAIGQTLTIANHSATIIGVMPRAFEGLTANLHPSVYLPFSFANLLYEKDYTTAIWPSHFGFYVLGRLKPGASLAQASAEIRTLEPSLRKDADPSGIYLNQFFKTLRLSVHDGSSGVSWLKVTYERPLLVLELLVALLLLLCSINTALVMLARVSGRQHEYALRVALGARRTRIVRQVLVEAVMLVVPGLALGIFLGWFGAHTLTAMLASDGPPQQFNLRPNAIILAVNAGAALLVAMGAGVIPAFRAARTAPALDLKAAARSVAARHLGGWAVILQVAVSICLLSTAILLGGTLARLLTAHSGFDFDNAAAASIDLDPLKLSDAQGNLLFNRFAAALESKPGVQSVGFTGLLPLSHHYTVSRTFSIDRHGVVHSNPSMFFASVTPGYFSATGTRILEGDSAPQATRASSGMANCVLGQSLARLFFPGEDPTGRIVYFATSGKPDGTILDPKAACRVVGIAEDVKYISLRRPEIPVLYQLFRLNVLSDYAPTNEAELIVRGASGSLALAAIRNAAAETIPSAAIVKSQLFIERADEDLSRERMLMGLSSTFAVLALLLTALGLYGLVMRSVTLRTREIGIRVALGARRGSILINLGRRTLLEIVLGVLAGTVIAMLIGNAIRRLLDMHAGAGAEGYLLAIALILLVAMLAVVAPARRATSVDPMQALRAE